MSQDPDSGKARTHVLPTKLPTEFEHASNLPKMEAHNYSSHLPVDTAPQTVHKPATGNDLQDKIYMFPESYNELRRELVTYWTHTIWPQVAWRMAFRAEEFVETMNEILGVAVVFDTAKVDFICRTYLAILRKNRGAA